MAETHTHQPKRLIIIAGDPSGDIHGSKVIQALKTIDPTLEIAGIGGPAMAKAGQHQVANQANMGKVGLSSLMAIPQHIKLGHQLLTFCETFQPDAVLHIDYGMFNLYMAEQFKKRHIKTLYYIPPQVWASRRGRIKKIKRLIDHVFCIFPFEETLYQNHDIPVTYVGHPLAGQLPKTPSRQSFCQTYGLNPEQPIVALFPGSRKGEILSHLGPMLGAIDTVNQHRKKENQPLIQAGLGLAHHFSADWLNEQIKTILQKINAPNLTLKLIPNADRHSLQACADAAIIKSGTSTLETALYKTPMTIVYKASWLTGIIAKWLCYYPVIGLPNILIDPYHPFLTELLQEHMTAEKMAHELTELLNPESQKAKQAHDGFQTIAAMMPEHSAAENVAHGVIQAITT